MLFFSQWSAVDIISNNRIQIKFWEIRKCSTGLYLNLLKTRLSQRIALRTSTRVSIHRGHLIISEPIGRIGDENDNVVDVKDLRNVRDVEHAYVRFRIRQFFHFNSDNISNPRFPKSSGGFSTRQYYQKRFYYVFDTFSLEVTPNSLVLRLGHAFD